MYHSDVDKQADDTATPSAQIRTLKRPAVLQLSVHQLVVSFLFTELLVLLISGFTPYWYLELGDLHAYSKEIATIEFEAVFLAAFIYLLVARVTGAYATNFILEPSHVVPRVTLGLVLTFGILMAIGAATKTTNVHSRLWFFSWFAATGVFVLSFRTLGLFWARRRLVQGGCVYRAISVGIFCRPMDAETMSRQTKNSVRCFEVMRFDDLQQIGSLADHIKHDIVDQIYITVPWQDAPQVMEHIDLLRHLSADIFVIPQDRRATARLAGSCKFGDQLSLKVTERPIHGWDVWFKRAQDVAVASVTLFIFTPVMLTIAMAIKIESRGPVIFRQKRAGFNGSIFEIWKFRSMYTAACDFDASKQTSKNDSRVTKVGRFIRGTSLDELPQLFNILQGTMSIVGPRPHALKTNTEGRTLEEIVDNYALRHRVKPGLTGWAQVNGYRGELDSIEKLRWRVNYDLEYIDNWSLAFDLKIILQTVTKLIYDPAAY
jgi:Undecaprenyl-phosphate glucose phosphotransferase